MTTIPKNIGQFIAQMREAEGLPDYEPSPVFHYMPDVRPYMSPLGTGEVTSRRQRREELKRSGCREVDPSEIGTFSKRHQESRAEAFLDGPVTRSKPYVR